MLKRQDRLMAIVLALLHKPATAGELAFRFEVSKRTILRDMQSLSEMGIPLYAVSGPAGGYHLMEGYRLPPLQLDSAEALAILVGLRSLTRMQATPFRQAAWTATDKMKAVLPEGVLKQSEPLLAYVELEVPERNVKTDLLPVMLEYTSDQSWVEAVYRSERHRRQLQLQLKRMYAAHGFWYCEAYSQLHGETRTFRVDRFESVQVMSLPADIEGSKPNRTAEDADNTGTYTADPDTSAQKGTRIVASLTYRGALLAEQDRHIGERVRQVTDDRWELEFVCPPSEWEWAVRFFYGIGRDAEVLEPARLRREIHAMAQSLCELYESKKEGDTSP